VTAPATRAPRGSYEGAGRQAAVALRGYSSVIVTSDDVEAAAHVAIGIGLAESAHRLVMIGDLTGGTSPLQALVADEDQHGIYDSFEFGTSFGRIAREVKGVNNLFIMPSGTESPGTEEILASVRWQQFASEFANADELLLLVVGADTRGLDKLASQVDGIVLVGTPRLDAVPTANILARVPHPTIIPPPKINLTPRSKPWSPLKVGLAAAALLAAGILGGAIVAPRFRQTRTAERPKAVVAVPVDSNRHDSATAAMPNALATVNPLDSATATAFSVEVLASNTSEGANFELKRYGSSMPSATISLVPIGDTEATWYKVYAGAYPDTMQANQLLALLRRRHVLADSAGSVVRVPLAFLVDSVPSQGGVSSVVRDKIAALASRGVTAYALLQKDGGALLYTGAFERSNQSSLAASALRVAGLTPVLAYRTGRTP
jgi:hypothetical protein